MDVISPFLYFIILALVKRLNGLRSKTGIIRLLLGSYAKQTLQDTFFFRLTVFYGLFDGLDSKIIDKSIQTLILKGYLSDEKEKIKLTELGEHNLSFLENQFIFFTIQDSEITSIVDRKTKKRVKDRLVLLVQVLSNLSQDQKNFVPIIEEIDAQEWVKRHLLPYDSIKIARLTSTLHQELDKLSIYYDEIEKQLLLFRFSGKHRTAFSWDQLKVHLELDKDELLIRYNLLLHKFIHVVCKRPEDFPLLYQLFYENNSIGYLSDSSRQTWVLIKNGKNVNEISRIRKIKESTIYDHLMEIIMFNPAFDISPFVEAWKEEEVTLLFQKWGVRSLGEYKANVHQEIGYAEIKLILTKLLALEGWGIC